MLLKEATRPVTEPADFATFIWVDIGIFALGVLLGATMTASLLEATCIRGRGCQVGASPRRPCPGIVNKQLISLSFLFSKISTVIPKKTHCFNFTVCKSLFPFLFR